MNLKSININFEDETVTADDGSTSRSVPLGSPEGFSIISKAMLRTGWDNKYVYSFSWLGRPIIQLPDDMIRIQELIYDVKPDVVIETGVAHGGSLVYYASILNAMGKGRVVGIDIEIRPHNREAIENHEMFPHIELFEGSSISDEIITQLATNLDNDEKTLIFLDANHTKEHVYKELELYSQFLSVGSYIVAMDGIMKDVVGAPRSQPDWEWNNPTEAARKFVEKHDNFVIVEPEIPFNEGTITQRDLSYWPGAYVKRIR